VALNKKLLPVWGDLSSLTMLDAEYTQSMLHITFPAGHTMGALDKPLQAFAKYSGKLTI
jgi:hypothetical protein